MTITYIWRDQISSHRTLRQLRRTAAETDTVALGQTLTLSLGTQLKDGDLGTTRVGTGRIEAIKETGIAMIRTQTDLTLIGLGMTHQSDYRNQPEYNGGNKQRGRWNLVRTGFWKVQRSSIEKQLENYILMDTCISHFELDIVLKDFNIHVLNSISKVYYGWHLK